MDNVQCAQKIKQMCKSRNIPVASMLEACGIRKSLIYDMEKRGKTPSAETINQIADYLNCSVDYLLDREQEKPAPINESELSMSMKDQRLVSWFRSLPEEKQKAILIAQDAPRELL